MAHVDFDLHGPVAVIRFSNPPVNALGYAVRREIAAALARASSEAAVKAIVLTGKGDFFSAGADVKEFGTAEATRSPTLNQLVSALEQSAKPVVAAIAGTALGGGFELALACHHRVAAAKASIGLPEIKLGILPGAGGTQRLPRLVGVEKALNMILSGEPLPAAKLADTPLLDRVTDGDPIPGAIELAKELGVRGTPPRRTGDIRVSEPNFEALCQFAHNTVTAMYPHLPAPAKCVEAIRASVRPIEEGSAIERELFRQLLDSSQSKGLRHSFFAERTAARIPDVPADTPTRPIKKAGVVGAGTMGGGIAMCLINAGIPVTLLEVSEAALEKGIATIRKNYGSAIKKGQLTAEAVEQRIGMIQPTLDDAKLADADIVIEAVFEDMEIKKAMFQRLDAVMKPGAILASNTSMLDLNLLARTTKRPQDVIGTHFFSPANIMRLLEVVRGKDTAKDVLATVMALAKKIKKTAVVAGVCDGFIGNRMLQQYARQAQFLVEEGASPRQIDSAIEAFGFAMGPFRVSDLAGNDISWATRKRRYAEQPDLKYSRIADKICELGRFGQKTSAGWYDYAPGDRTPRVSPVVQKVIEDYRAEMGVKPRQIDDQEIVDRLVLALVNEGARILEEGIAARASDIDVVYLTGYGFPTWRGGPMFYADQQGLEEVVRRMNQLAASSQSDPSAWKPAPLLERLAASGGKFQS